MPNIKPILTLTKSQWKRLLERIVSREQGAPSIARDAMQRPMQRVAGPSFNFPGEMGTPRSDLRTGPPLPDQIRGGIGTPPPMPFVRPDPTTAGMPTSFQRPGGPSPVDQVMQNQPPRQQVLGRLMQQKEGIPFSEPTPVSRDYPLLEARLRYMQNPRSDVNPGGYAPGGVPPPMRQLRTVEPGSLNDLTGKGVSYEGVKFGRVESAFERKARLVAPEETTASLPEILSTATALERMWQLMGGKRSVAGKMWNMLREGSPGRNKVVDTKDYFIRSGLRWREDPVKFSRQWPREAKLMNEIWQQLEQEVGPVGGGVP